MIDVIIDTLVDVVKLLPFLLVAFAIIEVVEHKLNKKTRDAISASGKMGPAVGGLLGLFPQCGFGAMATNLYITRIISLGTLIAVYLSTSDEMLPVMLSHKASFLLIARILLIKLLIGMVIGFVIDFIFRKKQKEKINYEICNEEHCHCEKGIVKSVLIHTFKTLLFILFATFCLNTVFYFIGEEKITEIFTKNILIGPFISSLIGLIPNCASSVMITELYMNNVIGFGTMIGGLLTGSGIGILLLFKSNKDMKENLFVLLTIYFVGAISGLIIEFIQVLF